MRSIFILPAVIASAVLFSFYLQNNEHNASSPAVVSPASEKLCIAFYNVENLFDTIDNAGIDDAEFLPAGKSQWTSEKYHTKINHIAKVVKAMNDGNGADILGLAEVENAGVVKDLVNDPQLKNIDYGIVHHESPDTRGIDVAMIYKKKSFKVIGAQFFHVDISQFEDKPTRDIVLVKGIDAGKDTLFIFLNHWPSRRGGTQETEPRRQIAATVLRKAIDSILLNNPNAKMIIMGDFNDNPTDVAISQILKATKVPDLNSKNSIYDAANIFNWKAGEGSEFYKGDWSRFIQIMVSTSLIKNQLSSDGTFHDIYLFKPTWLLINDDTYQQMVPYRTYEGNDKPMGYSDHLPVYLQLNVN